MINIKDKGNQTIHINKIDGGDYVPVGQFEFEFNKMNTKLDNYDKLDEMATRDEIDNELYKIISEAFIEYDVFNNSNSKKERHQRYINETTKALFKVEELNNEIMYNILQGIDFDMYFYFEWKNFANYLYNKLKEHNYF